MTKKIIFALATIVFLPQAFATTEPESIFQCGQDFQRELTVHSSRDYVLSEGFTRGGKDMTSSHAYFFVKDISFHAKKNYCSIEIRGQNISTPTEHVVGKRAFYKFKFHFAKNDPTSLVFDEDGKPPTTCTVSSKYINRLKDCSFAPELPEAMVCQSPIVQGTQIKTIFRMNPKTGASERQVLKLTVADNPLPTTTTNTTMALAAAPSSTTMNPPKILKEEDLGVRSTKFKWAVVDKICQLKINEADENQDQQMDFVMKIDGKPSAVQPAYFNKMRISLDKDHVADLLDDKKNVQCALSAELLHQAVRCASTTAKDETAEKGKEKKSHKHTSKKTSASTTN